LEDNLVMLRTEDWKYVFTSGKADLALGYATGQPPPGITHRLYNLKLDPGETHNLANDPREHLKLEELQNALLSRFKETHPYAKDLPAGAPIDEALSWFCEPPEIYVPAAKKK
jgi:choline-sulfatase